jgi:hypothetical protein
MSTPTQITQARARVPMVSWRFDVNDRTAARRLFYARIQAIWDIMYPDSGLEVGIDLLCNPYDCDIPGAVIDQILHNGEPDNSDVLEKCGIPTLSSSPIRSLLADHEEAKAS